LKKKKTSKEKSEQQEKVRKESTKQNELIKNKTLYEDEVPNLKYISKNTASFIQKERLAKNLTQDQLAKLCNLSATDIKNIESNPEKTIYNPAILNKISKVLGVKIPRQ
jgi:ribosome-binding protein aMBF1 (putative translation factor)